nr:CocE/NonD family hydrolase [Sphingomonas sp. Y57]
MIDPFPLLGDVAPDLQNILDGAHHAGTRFEPGQIRKETVLVAMRDGIRLATDLYFPPVLSAPTIAIRTPYGRETFRDVSAFAEHGYVVAIQDVRGTGDSEPDHWDSFIYEGEDGVDFVEWVTHQPWYDGFVGSAGGSYLGTTQWGMSLHPRMSAIAPEVAGIGVSPVDTPNYHLYVNAFSRSVGKGEAKVPISYVEMEHQMMPETLATGYFNSPLHLPWPDALFEHYPVLRGLSLVERKRWLWERFLTAGPVQRADLVRLVTGEPNITLGSEMSALFGHHIPYGLFTFPQTDAVALIRSLNAPALVTTGWYDWGNGDTLATWQMLARDAVEPVRSRSRLVITPNAHNMPGYREGREGRAELDRIYRITSPDDDGRAIMRDLLLRWYAAVRADALDDWPVVTYYLMGAGEWRSTPSWPPPEARMHSLYIGAGGTLSPDRPWQPSPPDSYVYDPHDPAPTLGGSILSSVYAPGSVDVSEAQCRADVLCYTTAVLTQDVDVIGPLRLILYASSSAIDTDFTARISDVFPDGRAIQLLSSTLRARYRDPDGQAMLLEPDRVYRFEIDLWATANRFKAGHRLRLDIASADFPKFDRNANLGGGSGEPVPATQSVFHDPDHPTHLLVSILGAPDGLLGEEPAEMSA